MGTCLEHVGEMFGECWESVGEMLGACMELVKNLLGNYWENVFPLPAVGSVGKQVGRSQLFPNIFLTICQHFPNCFPRNPIGNGWGKEGFPAPSGKVLGGSSEHVG